MKATTHFSLVMQNYRHCVQKRRLTYDTLSCIININKHADIFATRKIKHYHALFGMPQEARQALQLMIGIDNVVIDIVL